MTHAIYDVEEKTMLWERLGIFWTSKSYIIIYGLTDLLCSLLLGEVNEGGKPQLNRKSLRRFKTR